MDKICRLCFFVIDNGVHGLAEESEMMTKLNSCLRLELSPIEDFPKQICEECRKKIEDIHQFRERVMQNEIKLIHYLNNNSLKSFFLQLANGVEVKDESIPKSNQMFKEEEESQDSNNFDVAYLAPHIITEIPQIRTVNELNLRNDKVLKKKSNPKTRIKQNKSNKKTKSQNVNRKVIRRDKYAEHDPNKCLTCFKLYDSSLDLSKHYKTDHSIEPGGLKPENDIEMTDKYTLHSQDGQKAFYKCNSCGDSKEDLEDIKKHVIQHKYERPFICKLCGKTYKTVYEIVRHGRVHSGFKLFCQHGCGYSSPYPGAMRDHEKRHTDERNVRLHKYS